MNKKDFETEELEKDVGAVDLSPYVAEVVEELRRDGKYPATHTYVSTLHSFAEFSGGRDAEMPMQQVFTPGRLKEYEDWLLVQRELSLNTVSTYMRTLRAVYNRWMQPGSPEHNPKLFDDVYTKVVSQTKRALTTPQINQLMYADTDALTHEQKCVFAYFLLMFLFRGMPFIDLAHLRKKDVQGRKIVYRRHKTGKHITVKITREAMLLIKEFQDKNSQSVYLFPILDAQLRGGWKQYQCYQEALRKFNRMLKKLACTLLPGVKVSSYTARHTWATLAFHMGTPATVICQALGHSSILVTETYLKPFEDEQIDETNDKVISSVRKCKGGNRAVHNTL